MGYSIFDEKCEMCNDANVSCQAGGGDYPKIMVCYDCEAEYYNELNIDENGELI